MLKSSILNSILSLSSIGLAYVNIGISARILSPYEFGVFSTLYVLLQWFHNFDGGIGNQLRNKYMVAHNEGDIERKRTLVFEAYKKSAAFLIGLLGIVSIAVVLIDWKSIFKTDEEIHQIVFLICLLGVATIFTRTVNKLFFAINRPEIVFVVPVLSNFAIFCVLQLIHGKSPTNLTGIQNSLSVLWVFALPTPLLYLAATGLYLFQDLGMRIKRNLLSELSIYDSLYYIVFQFMAALTLVLVPMAISAIADPVVAGHVNIYFRYYMAVSVFVNVFMQLAWREFSLAYVENDYNKLARTLKLALLFNVAIVLVLLMLFAISGYILPLWIGSNFSSNLSVEVCTLLLVLSLSFKRLSTTALQSIGHIQVVAMSSSFSLFACILAAYALKEFAIEYLFAVVVTVVGLEGLFLFGFFWYGNIHRLKKDVVNDGE